MIKGMRTIEVITPFIVNLHDGKQHRFAPGRHEVDDAIAEHWYVKTHSKPVDTPGEDTPAAPPAERENYETPEVYPGTNLGNPPAETPPPAEDENDDSEGADTEAATPPARKGRPPKKAT